MLRQRVVSIALACCAVTLLSAARPTPIVGPPWISIEYPANPYDRTTRGAYLLVHAFYHGTPIDYPVSGSAQGIVDGRRRSVQLAFEKTSRTGVYSLRKQWASEGTWTLLITVNQSAGDGVTAVVELGARGDVAAVRVPTERRDGYEVPSKVNMREIESGLAARAGNGQLSGRGS